MKVGCNLVKGLTTTTKIITLYMQIGKIKNKQTKKEDEHLWKNQREDILKHNLPSTGRCCSSLPGNLSGEGGG